MMLGQSKSKANYRRPRRDGKATAARAGGAAAKYRSQRARATKTAQSPREHKEADPIAAVGAASIVASPFMFRRGALAVGEAATGWSPPRRSR